MELVDFLILGAGWTSDFLIPLLQDQSITFAATTRDGSKRSGYDTIGFRFDPDSGESGPFKVLPDAKTVLIVFPIYKSGASEKLVTYWKETHPDSAASFIQLGSTGIWNGDPTLDADGTKRKEACWCDRHSPFDTTNNRANAEIELLELSTSTPTTVLNLPGLWGGKRNPRNWVNRVAPTKEALAKKGSIHLLHGLDVARAILAVHEKFNAANGQRWLLTDGRIYDWWDLASAWGDGGASNKDSLPTGPHPTWVRELMQETGVRGLPRPPAEMDRALDSREFWSTFGLSPAKARLEE